MYLGWMKNSTFKIARCDILLENEKAPFLDSGRL